MRCFLLLLFCLTPCIGQSGRAELFGIVEDPASGRIAGVRVQAVDQSTMAAFDTVATDHGEYHLLGLPSGNYVVTAEASGFQKFRATGITLRIADRMGFNIRLTIGDARQSLDVTAAATLLKTTGGDVGFGADAAPVAALPLDGRNYVPLIALSPGVALPGGGSLLPRINGSRPRTNEYLYDGISILQPEPGQVVFYPVIDGIEEFRVNINAYSPEYGRSNGGTVMVVGKSGGNQLHGTLFEFFRNEALNARNRFAQPGPNPEFRRHQYGLTLGGPIRRDKTFFFADWQGTRLRTGITRFSTVPTAAQQQGIFAVPIYDPATSPRLPFPGNAIPGSRRDPIAVRVAGHYPLPDLSGTANNFVRTAVEPDSQDQFDARLDHFFNARNRVFGRYSYFADDDNPVAPLPDGSGSLTSGAIGHAFTRGDSIASGYDRTVSPTALNQARFGYSHRSLHQTSLQDGGVAVPGIPPNAYSSVLPVFSVAGYQQIGPTAAANTDFRTSVTELLDTFSLVRGRHTLKFGADLRREALEVFNPPNPTGSFTVNTTGSNSSAVADSGNAFASLLLGQVNAFTIDLQPQPIEERAHVAEFFAADDWRVSNRLTVNLGTRYTLNFPSTIASGRSGVLNLSTRRLDYPATARNVECCDFGPRAGLAWRVSESLAIRSGYGMVWFEQSGITTPFTLPQFPLIQSIGQQSPDNVNPAFVLAHGPAVQAVSPGPGAGLGQGAFGVDRSNGSGYSQQWNLTVQKTVGNGLSLEAGYLGSKNTRLGIPDANINQLPAAYLAMGAALSVKVANPYYGVIPASSTLGGPTLAQQQLLRAFPEYTTVALFRDNVGNSGYNALDALVEKRLSNEFTLTLAYTWSKLIDDASSVFSQTIFSGPVLNNTGPADAFNRHLERDVSNGDIPQVLAASWVYDIPKVWKISGWRIAGIVRVQSGGAVAVSQATNLNAGFGFAVQRPNRVSDPNDLPGRNTGEWFNTAAFVPVGQFVIGNSSRNPVRGPGLQNADLMLGKTVRLTERASFEFRAEVFNVSNTPPLNDPNGSMGSAAFGTISGAGNPRVFEFAGKVRF